MTRAPRGATVIGKGRPHDTERPDIETASDAYAARFAGEVGRWLLAEQERSVQQLLDAAGAAPLRILEVGGGHGQLAPMLLARGHDVTVHGSSPECFGRVSRLEEEFPGRFRTAASSLWRLPFAARSFDLVLAVRLLGHTARWRELIAEMARVSDRWLILEFARTAMVSVPRLAEAVFVLKQRVEGHTTRPFFSYREWRLVQELRRHSFSPASRAAMFSLPMVLHRVMRDPARSRRVEEGLRRVGVGDRFRSPAMLLAERDRDGTSAD